MFQKRLLDVHSSKLAPVVPPLSWFRSSGRQPDEAGEHVGGRCIRTEAGVHGQPHGEPQPDVGTSKKENRRSASSNLQ